MGELDNKQQDHENKLGFLHEFFKQDSENSMKVYEKVGDIPAQISMSDFFCVNAVTVLKNQLSELTDRLANVESARPLYLWQGYDTLLTWTQ